MVAALSITARALIVAVALLTSVATAAQIRTFVDPKVLDETETLRLTLRLEGSRSAPAPDLAALEQNFEVLGSSSSSQYRSINGQVQSWVEYQINLRPRSTGTLTIPALELGGERSDPTSVQVRALDPVLREEIDRMVFFETQVSPTPVYVQAELIFTRRLYYSTSGGVQMYSDLPGAPELADAVVLPLEEARSFAERRGDIDYGVVEQRFAIYPERSGSITIPAVALTSSVRVLKNGRMRRSGIRVSSEPVTVRVLPIPPEYPAAAPWLPATAVSVRQSIDPQNRLRTGSPLNHSVSVEVQGNVSSAIAPVATASDPVLQQALRTYPEAPATSDFVRSGTNIGRRDQTTSLLPVTPGELSLPTLEVTWWDTTSNQVRIARAAAIPLQIGGAPVAAAANLATGNTEANEADAAQAASAKDNPSLVTEVDPLKQWPWLLLLAIVAAALWIWGRRPYQQGLQRLRLAGQQFRRPQRPATRAAVRKSLANQLQRSAAMAPTLAASARRTALIVAVAERLQIDRRSAVARLHDSAEAGAVLMALNEQCYGEHNGTGPADEVIIAALDHIEPTRRSAMPDVLPTLYPER